MSAPDCIDCKWFFPTDDGEGVCTHTLALTRRGGIVFGERTVQPDCRSARLPTEMCGIIGRLFEDRVPA